MKVGGGLNYVTGPMGSGKSLYGVRQIVKHLLAGNYVVTNVELLPGALERVAKRSSRLTTGSAGQRRLLDRLQERYVFTTELDHAMRHRLPGKGEGRGLFVWDETHNDLNNRDWRKDGRDEILKWATQLRKLGFVGYLLSQHADNTDAALRRVCNFQVRLQNQREQTRVLGLRLTPWPLFLAVWMPTNTPLTKVGQPMKVERYFLDWHRHLYDTHGVFHGVENELGDDVILLGGGETQKGLHRPVKEGLGAPSDPKLRVIASHKGERLPVQGSRPSEHGGQVHVRSTARQ